MLWLGKLQPQDIIKKDGYLNPCHTNNKGKQGPKSTGEEMCPYPFIKISQNFTQFISKLKLTNSTPSGILQPKTQSSANNSIPCVLSHIFPDLPVVFIVVIPCFHPGGEIIQKRVLQENVLMKKYAIILGAVMPSFYKLFTSINS